MKRFSMIKPDIKRRLLLKGMVLGLLGMALLIGMGTFATVETLSTWGIPTFFLAIFLIGTGLIPYRNLTRLETHPHQLLFEKKKLHFISTHGNHLSIAYKNIDKVTYVETPTRYGIRLELKGKKPLFFPYFSSDTGLDEIVHANKTNEPL